MGACGIRPGKAGGDKRESNPGTSLHTKELGRRSPIHSGSGPAGATRGVIDRNPRCTYNDADRVRLELKRMRKSLLTLGLLLLLGPALAVPATFWHHHAEPIDTGHCDHHAITSADEPTAPAAPDDETDEHCPVCVFSKLTQIELPSVTLVVVETRQTLPTIPPTTTVVVITTPLTLDARGPPAIATIA